MNYTDRLGRVPNSGERMQNDDVGRSGSDLGDGGVVGVKVTVQIQLSPASLAGLPLELREQLLRYLQRWGEPAEQIEVAEQLRLCHGPRPGLLDYLACACLAAGQPLRALEWIERRQRRNTTVTSQSLEARTLLALGRREDACRVAAELARTHPRAVEAVVAAGEVWMGAGEFAEAASVLAVYLQASPYDLAAMLRLTQLALVQQQQDLAEQQWHQLGGGIPVGIDRESLVLLGELAGQLGKQETARSVQRELQHRQQQELAQLQLALAPVCGAAELLQKDPAAFYRRQTGLDSVQLTEPERQQVQLAVIRHFGHLLLREGQAEVIALTWLRSQSALMVMPTGGGKSLCYQLPALLLPRTTLVISPLIALMKDQVDGLPRGMQGRAVLVNSTLDERELAKRLAAVARGEYKLVYAAPERLRQHSFLHALRRAGLDLFVVDEAHCVSLWGHDFRPDYLFIGAARLALGNPPALAVTATAPPQVRDEIAETLSDRGQKGAAHPPKVIVLDIFRPNLHLSALQFHNDDQKLVALLDYAARSEGSGIVYVNSRSRAESVALALRRAGVSAEAYHAGLALRAPIQDRFMQNQTRVIVATVAFGMGIDKPDIRFIVHFHPSRSLDAYYQEVGRAGRDGLPSQGLLFYNYNDWANLRRWARADQQSVLELRSVYAAIAAQLKVEIASAGEAAGAEQPQPAQGRITVPGSLPAAGTVDLRRLVQILNSDETELRVAVSLLERAGLLRRGFDLPTEVEIRVQGPLGPTDLADRSLARLLRGLQLGQEQSATFATAQIAAFMRWEQTECELRLLEWQEGGALSLRFGRRALWIELPEEPADFGQRLDRLLAESDVERQRRIDEIIGYATTDGCRHGYLSSYFGSPPRARCVVCDNCTGVRPSLPYPERVELLLPEDVDIEPMVIDCLVSLPMPVGRSGLARILTGSLRAPVQSQKARHYGALKALGEGMVLSYIDELVEQNRLRLYTRQGYPVLAPTLRGRIEAESWLADHPDLALPAATDPEYVDEAETRAGSEASERYTELQRALWRWRSQEAARLMQPSYVVMRNELILAIAVQRPQTLEALQKLPGLGTQRLQQYGKIWLDLVNLHPPQLGDDERLQVQQQLAEQARANQRPARAVSPQAERQLFLRLQELRQKLAVDRRVHLVAVASDSLLRQIAAKAPHTAEELSAIAGFGQSGLASAARQILAAVAASLEQQR